MLEETWSQFVIIFGAVFSAHVIKAKSNIEKTFLGDKRTFIPEKLNISFRPIL